MGKVRRVPCYVNGREGSGGCKARTKSFYVCHRELISCLQEDLGWEDLESGNYTVKNLGQIAPEGYI